jgi:Cu/Ag efflux protein CusF
MTSSTRLIFAFCLFAAALASTPDASAAMAHKMDMSDNCVASIGEGVVNALNLKKSAINISHKPIAAIGLTGKTTEFPISASVAKSIRLATLKPGTRVHFLLTRVGETPYAIASICAIGGEDHDACMDALHEATMESAKAAKKPCEMKSGKPAGEKAAAAGDRPKQKTHH